MNMLSKDEMDAETEARCVAWVAKQPKDRRPYFCPHGRYWGFKGALRFMSKCCRPGQGR